MKKVWIILLACIGPGSLLFAQNELLVKTADGQLQGVTENGVRVFKGIPYAKPPVGPLRWKDPQPMQPWKGVRKCDQFGNRSYQRNAYADMVLRSEKESEDCLYLNVWTNAGNTNRSSIQVSNNNVTNAPNMNALPVLVYFHGGGLSSGEGSELRYDGQSMATKGIIMVTVNYRLGVFGFLAGNYGFMDQRAALQWVQKNIKAFGGDPKRVTIAGQSAGSISVSAHMASPLSKGLFSAAIGESGSILGALPPISLEEAKRNADKLKQVANVKTLEELRKIPAEQLHKLSMQQGVPYFNPTIDGKFLTKPPMEIFATGLQADVPLLAGWTADEGNWQRLLGKEALTVDNYVKEVKRLYGDKGEQLLQFYPATNDSALKQSATDLASDRFIAYSTWKWLDLHGKTSGSTVYRYLFAKHLPDQNAAPHSADISYALGNHNIYKVYPWTDDDKRVSNLMQSYFINFIKTGNPNGEGLPEWPGLQASIPKVMVFDTETKAVPEKNLKRYVFLDQFYYQ